MPRTTAPRSRIGTKGIKKGRRPVTRTTAPAPKQYASSAIPYEVSKPGSYWRIKKGLDPDIYWKKRYWRRRITGRGDYSYSAGNNMGANLGGYLGSKAGEFLGGMAHNAVAGLVTGLGDYNVSKNVLLGGNMPSVRNLTSGGDVVISYQEYLGDIITASHDTATSSSSPFKIETYLINAANPRTFPFLSQIAQNFEQYEFEGILFGFRTTSADIVTNDTNNIQLGTVLMATQYDVADANFSSKGEMLNYQFSTSVKPSQPAVHMIECAPNQTPVNLLYTVPGTNPVGTDPRLYHLGRFSIATQGFQGSAVTIGELHVTYQVRLLKPKLWQSLGETFPWAYTARVIAPINDSTACLCGPAGTDFSLTYQNTPGFIVSIRNVAPLFTSLDFPLVNFKRRLLITMSFRGRSEEGFFKGNGTDEPTLLEFVPGGQASIVSYNYSPLDWTNNSLTAWVRLIVDLTPQLSNTASGVQISPATGFVGLPLQGYDLIVFSQFLDPTSTTPPIGG